MNGDGLSAFMHGVAAQDPRAMAIVKNYVEPTVPRVLGLDTDSYGYHWCSTIPLAGQACDSVRSKDSNVNVRRQETAELAYELFHHDMSMVSDLHIFCEEPLALKNGKTTRLLGLAAGAIYGAFAIAKPDAYWHWVDVASWKKKVVGNGNASKEMVREWVLANSPSVAEAQDHFDQHKDLYDAYCLMRYGIMMREEHGW